MMDSPPQSNELRARFEKLPSKKLRHIIEVESEDYRPEAIETARQVWTAREQAGTLADYEPEFGDGEVEIKDYATLRGESRRAGCVISLILLGVLSLVRGISTLFDSEADPVDATFTTGGGLWILIIGIFWIREIKKRQSEAPENKPWSVATKR